LYRVLILNENKKLAKEIQDVPFSDSINATHKAHAVEYYSTVDDAFTAAVEHPIDLFVIGVSSAEDDIGIEFAKRLTQTKEYGVSFIIFVAEKINDKIIDAIYCEPCWISRLYELPLNKQSFSAAVTLISKYNVVRRNYIRDKDSPKDNKGDFYPFLPIMF